MFTGIIGNLGKVLSFDKSRILCIRIKNASIALGDSVAVNGVCLTAMDIQDNDTYAFQLSEETISCTNFVNLTVGDLCNIELAMLAQHRFGGHFVSGHVDGTASIISIVAVNDCKQINIKYSKNQAAWISKGSVALNGVSLTVNIVKNNEASIMLVPHTLQNTNLANLCTGDIVNIEFDMIYKMVQHQVLQCQK